LFFLPKKKVRVDLEKKTILKYCIKKTNMNINKLKLFKNLSKIKISIKNFKKNGRPINKKNEDRKKKESLGKDKSNP
jgi:hypothetical protein